MWIYCLKLIGYDEAGLVNFVCIVFELGDKMLTLSSMENRIVQCNLLGNTARIG